MSIRTRRNNRRPKPGGPSQSSKQMLFILTYLVRKPMYEGTVTAAVKRHRRAANKAARIARRANRG